LNSDYFDKKYPYAADAERAVIGSCIISERCIPDVLDKLSSEDFFLEENRILFEGIQTMSNLNQKVDALTLVNHIKQSGKLDESGGRSYVAQLLDVTPTPANVLEYAAIVKENSLLRRLAMAASDIYDKAVLGEGEASLVLDAAEQQIYDIRSGKTTGGLTHIQTIVVDNFKKISDAARQGGIMPGHPSGFDDLDTALSGLNPSDLIILAGRPGTGKTSFALNIARAVASKTNKDVAFFSLEMAKEQIVLRMMSTSARIDLRRLREGNLSDREWTELASDVEKLASEPIYIDDTSDIGVAEIKARCRRRGDNIGLVVIDYLQLMKTNQKGNGGNRVLEVGELSRSLKIMAKELQVPILCLSQMSRAVEQGKRKPLLSDLRDSGSIEQDADAVLFLYREDPTPENPGAKNQCECIIAKNRHGDTSSIKLHWEGRYTRFTGIDKKHQDDGPPPFEPPAEPQYEQIST